MNRPLMLRAATVTKESLVGAAVASKVLTQAGVLRPYGPKTLGQLAATVAQWGMGLAGGFASAALRFPHHIGVIDERGSLTFADIEARSNALAHELLSQGIRAGDSVALLARNHRGFIDAAIAVAKVGADLVLLNTAFAGPQIGEVCTREKVVMLMYDEEFTEVINDAALSVPQLLTWVEERSATTQIETTEALIRRGDATKPPVPAREGRVVVLTSGTTGTPKGAPRGGGNLAAAVALLQRMPLRTGWRCHVAAPMFHTWGYAHLALGMLLGTTLVLSRRFDPLSMLHTLSAHRCDSLAVIPVMLQRVLELPPAELARFDVAHHLKVVASSGSALPGDLALEWMDRFGDNLYNIYGSTEVAWASVAQPEDLRAAPGTAGKPPVYTHVKILDEDDERLPVGQIGRIFVTNSMVFDGYSGGGQKEQIGGLMSSGDLGYFDAEGRLYVVGRDDDMIVSGGENVFPQEVEDCLIRHEQVNDVAIVGVEDADFGQRLKAFVVRNPGAQVTAKELQDYVRSHLARFKVPKEVIFLEALPRNATGKILKRQLLERTP